jgi:hypothetical protein
MQSRLAVILFLLFLVFTWGIFSARPQSGGAVVQNSPGIPTGSCQPSHIDIDSTTGNLWTCKNGTWMLASLPGSIPLRGVTGTITGTLLALGSCDTGTATVTGAVTSMPALASPVSDPGTGIVWNALVSSPNTVTVKECALVLSTPNNTAYQVVVNP